MSYSLILSPSAVDPCTGEEPEPMPYGFPRIVAVDLEDEEAAALPLNMHVRYEGDLRSIIGWWEVTDRSCTAKGHGTTATIALKDYLRQAVKE